MNLQRNHSQCQTHTKQSQVSEQWRNNGERKQNLMDGNASFLLRHWIFFDVETTVPLLLCEQSKLCTTSPRDPEPAVGLGYPELIPGNSRCRDITNALFRVSDETAPEWQESRYVLIHSTPSSGGCDNQGWCTSHHTPPPSGGAGLSSHLSIFTSYLTTYKLDRIPWFLVGLSGQPPCPIWSVTWSIKNGCWDRPSQLFQTKYEYLEKIYEVMARRTVDPTHSVVLEEVTKYFTLGPTHHQEFEHVVKEPTDTCLVSCSWFCSLSLVAPQGAGACDWENTHADSTMFLFVSSIRNFAPELKVRWRWHTDCNSWFIFLDTPEVELGSDQLQFTRRSFEPWILQGLAFPMQRLLLLGDSLSPGPTCFTTVVFQIWHHAKCNAHLHRTHKVITNMKFGAHFFSTQLFHLPSAMHNCTILHHQHENTAFSDRRKEKIRHQLMLKKVRQSWKIKPLHSPLLTPLLTRLQSPWSPPSPLS